MVIHSDVYAIGVVFCTNISDANVDSLLDLNLHKEMQQAWQIPRTAFS